MIHMNNSYGTILNNVKHADTANNVNTNNNSNDEIILQDDDNNWKQKQLCFWSMAWLVCLCVHVCMNSPTKFVVSTAVGFCIYIHDSK